MDIWQFVFDTVSFWIFAFVTVAFIRWVYHGFEMKYPGDEDDDDTTVD